MNYASVLHIAGMCYYRDQDKERVLNHVGTWGFNPSEEDLERAYAELERDRKASLKDGRTVTVGIYRGKWVIDEFGDPKFVEEQLDQHIVAFKKWMEQNKIGNV